MSLLLGLRLTFAGGRDSLLRVVFAAAGVGVGTTLLLLALTGPFAMHGRDVRGAWQSAAYAYNPQFGMQNPPARSADGALFLAVSDYFDGALMTRTYVAALGADPPVPPGLERLPGPGEVAASPAMRQLFEATPDDQLDDRFPGRVTMTIADAGLTHPGELVAIIGRTPDQLSGVRSVQEVRGFDVRWNGFVVIFGAILVVGSGLLLGTIVVLILMVTRVAAAQREQRLATIRLAGATRLQTAVVAAIETGVGALAGSVLAWAAYEVGRRVLAANVVFMGGPFFLEDVAVPPEVLALVLVGMPILAILITVASLRRVQVDPLSVSRRGVRRPPSARTALPVVAGIGGLLLLDPLERVVSETTLNRLTVLFTVLVVGGLVLVGPLLCLLAGRGLVRISRSAPALLAARRITADPGATFRAISGVVLAAMVVVNFGTTVGETVARTAQGGGGFQLRPGVVQVIPGGVSAQRIAPLLSEQTVVIGFSSGPSCAQLARVIYRSCPYVAGSGQVEPPPGTALPGIIHEIYILTDGTLAAENRVRTQVANLVPNAIMHADRDVVDSNEFFPTDLARLASIGFTFMLLVGACSLTAGMIGGLIERRRPFALLRASGVRLGELRRVVFLEVAATMVFTTVLGAGLGLATSYAASRQGTAKWKWPDLTVFGYVGCGVLAALLFAALALPLLSATTRHDAVRYE